MTDPHGDIETLVPAGLPLMEAASWIGNACWVELRLVEIISGWLSDSDDVDAACLWSIRSGAAQRAEGFHRRLPLLNEFPQSGFVVPSSSELEIKMQAMDSIPGAQESGGASSGENRSEETPGAARQVALGSVLRVLADSYEVRQSVACGPADAPLAVLLVSAADGLRASIDAYGKVPDSHWFGDLDAIGCP